MCKYIECISCVLRQATEAVQQAGLTSDMQVKVMRHVLDALSEMTWDEGSCVMIQRVFRIIREVGGVKDPLENIKSYCMDIALRAYPELKLTVEQSQDRFGTAVRIAMAGNIIDHGRKEQLDNLALFRSVEDALTRPLAINHIPRLKEEIESARSILYLADNAGETVFDRIFIEELPKERIKYVVRGIPVSNDATLRDAEFSGITDLVDVVEDGSDYPCVRLESCSDTFRRAFDEADLIIAKGQANMQSLLDQRKKIYFLVRIRCHVVASLFDQQSGAFQVRGLHLPI